MQLRASLLAFGLGVFLLAEPARARGDVYVVDLDGGGDFTSVQPAVDQALAGDVILVRSPADVDAAYPAFTVDKGVTVLGLGANAAVNGVRVSEVPAGPPVVLANLVVFPDTYAVPGQPLRVERNLASVWIQDCLLSVSYLEVELSDVIAVDVGVEAYGETATRTGHTDYAPAVRVRDGRLAGYGIEAQGGSGGVIIGYFVPVEGGDGGAGLQVRGSSHVVVSGSAFHGGNGDQPLTDMPPAIGGDAGAGIDVAETATVVMRATRASEGNAGPGTQDGAEARAIEGEVELAGVVGQSLAGITSAAEALPVSLVVGGAPGTHAYLIVSEQDAWRPQGLGGARHVGAPIGGAPIDLGIVPPDGQVVASWTPPLQPAGRAEVLHLQVAFDAGGSTLEYGPARAVVVFDDAWVPGRLHVDASAPPGGDGSSWANAFDDLNEALASSSGLVDLPTEIWVREGVYTPAPAGGDRGVFFYPESGTHVFGGFAGGETDLDQRDPRAHPVVLSGDLDRDDGLGAGSLDDNSITVLAAGAAHLVSSHHEPYELSAYRGPTRRRQNILLDGLRLRGSNSDVLESSVAGVHVLGDVRLVDSVIEGHAGGTTFRSYGSSATLVHCRFVGNRSVQELRSLVSTVNYWRRSGADQFIGCEFVDNQCRINLIEVQTKARFTGCTLYRNRAFTDFGRMLYTYVGDMVFENCVLWDNDFAQDALVGAFGSLQIGSSLYQGPHGIGGNVAGPPRFVDAHGPDGILGTDDDDLGLGPLSPCVDAGSNAALPSDALDLDRDGDVLEPIPVDLLGQPRRVDDPFVVDTGDGAAPLVDMGARERQ